MAEGTPYSHSPAPLDPKDIGRYVESELRRIAASIDWLWNPTFTAAMGAPLNLSLSFSVLNNALTMTVKGQNGANPSPTNTVYFPFPSSTASSGTPVWRPLKSSSSITISSGSTAGHNSGLKQYLYWYMVDNSGTLKPAFSSKFFGLHGIATTVAEGGAGAADSGITMYADSAYSNVPFVCVGYTEDTQTTAGTWATAPSAVHLAPFTLPVISFSAHKNATNQTAIVTATITPLTFSTEIFDNGDLFSTSSSRWTPPPGTVTFAASALFNNALTDGATLNLHLYKNNLAFKTGRAVAAGTTQSHVADIAVIDECNGIDFYDFRVEHDTGTDEVISGNTAYTWAVGSWSPGRS